MFPDTGLMESTLPSHYFKPLKGKNIATANKGRGEGLLATRLLLYLPTYKIVRFEEALTARASPHHKQPTCQPLLADFD